MTEKRLHSHEHHLLRKGIFLLIVATLFFTAMYALSRSTAKMATIPMILFFQNLVCLICILPAAIKGRKELVRPKQLKLIVFRSILGLATYSALFLAVQYTSLVNTMLLGSSSPILLPLLLWIWLKVKIDHRLWLGIAIGFIGIFMILQPTLNLIDVGSLLALGAAAFNALIMISIHLMLKSIKMFVILFYYFLISTVLTLPLALWYWKPLSLEAFIHLISIGVLASIGQWTWSRAFRCGRLSQLGPFSYMTVVWAVIFDWFLDGSIPTTGIITGIVLVCLGGILTVVWSKPIHR